MFRKRLVIALFLVLTGLGSIYLLPKSYAIRESAIIMVLPSRVGEWTGFPKKESELERNSLAEDTEFEKAVYAREPSDQPFRYDQLEVSVVLSGHDMNNSIHRPERCLPAQGFVIQSSSVVPIEIDGRTIKMRRLISYRKSKDETKIPNITYYWFTGAEEITSGHYSRTFIDMKDRLLLGNNQRWAYASITGNYGVDDIRVAKRSESETDAMIVDFIRKVFPKIHKPGVFGAAPDAS